MKYDILALHIILYVFSFLSVEGTNKKLPLPIFAGLHYYTVYEFDITIHIVQKLLETLKNFNLFVR